METGTMQLAVADAPVDGAQSVVVRFTGVELTGNSGNPIEVTFASPKASICSRRAAPHRQCCSTNRYPPAHTVRFD